ncbi:MAG TPA: prenyltransferase/squalene oxidase repeat-containing protein, partial [Chloroflexota bacterium]|nr:prenyltransferase/squalene oxidase repeat-containing protein [Chloroflexota bacterium]
YLRAQQRQDTHWVGDLSSSALATAMSMVALQVVDGRGYHDRIHRGRAWLLATQQQDGGWGDAMIDASNINSTSLALTALRFTGRGVLNAEEQQALARAQRCLDGFGGWAAVGDPARCTMSGPCRTVAAIAGIMDPKRIKHLRPEVILLPRRLRRTISVTFPAYLTLSTLHTTMASHPLNVLPTYRRALTAAESWLAKAQGPDGSFEESAFLTSILIMALTSAGRGNLPWLPAAIQYVVRNQRADGAWPIDRDLENFDTAMTVFAFKEAGLAVPQAERVRAWLVERQFTEPFFPTGAPAGGWAWARPDGWPDCDDTAYALLALRRLDLPASAPAIRRGVRWLEWMQNGDGAWPTFVRNSKLPFDHSCPYITGHVLAALQAAGRLRERPRLLDRALVFLAGAQRYDGSFSSIWFRETVTGTASVLEAMADCALLHTPVATGARAALLLHQNDDGGWGGIRRLQASTAEETAVAIMALLRCPPDDAIRQAVTRGVDWLIGHQQPDGTWAPYPIALYMSALWYSNTSYALTLPMQALARAQAVYARA